MLAVVPLVVATGVVAINGYNIPSLEVILPVPAIFADTTTLPVIAKLPELAIVSVYADPYAII